MTQELVGTTKCPICGLGYPHSHDEDVVEAETNSRPAFEAWYFEACKGGKLGYFYRISGWGLQSAFSRKFSEDYVGGPPASYIDDKIEALWQLWRAAWLRTDQRQEKVFVNRFAHR